MKRLFTVLLPCLLLISPALLQAGDYDRAWTALWQNDNASAVAFFQKAVKNKDNPDNALAMLIMLEAYEGKQYHTQYGNALEQFLQPDAYIYGLWFYDAILGNYGKKSGEQLAALNRIAAGENYPGSLVAAAAYFKGLHFLISQQLEEADKQFKKIGALESWQFAGPFDNVNGSGFNKVYGPVQEPVSAKGFLSSNNNRVNWFSPSPATNQGWVFVLPMFTQTSAVGYAQTFVYSPADQDAALCLGGYGALKVWVNDQLLLAAEEEKRTELDAYQAPCRLRKGYNRVLVQIGYTPEVGTPNFIVRLTDTASNRPLKDISSTATVQKYPVERSAASPASHIHFAEAYFLKRIQERPDDPAYPLLLSKVYLRCQQYDKAKEALYELYKKYPENPFMVNSYTECLSPQFEGTQSAELVEKVKLLDPQNYWVLLINEGKLEKEKKYDEALVMVNDLIAENGSNTLLELKKINLLSQQAKLDSAILLLKQLYAGDKQNADLVNTMALYYKHVLKNSDSVIAILEAFEKNNYHYNLNKFLADEYFERNETDKGLQVLKNLLAATPYMPESYQPLVQHFFSKQQYDSAIYYLQRMAGISPYNHSPLADIANCCMQQNDTRQALAYYRKALSFYPGGFDYRRRIRELEKKPDLLTCFPEADYYGAIAREFSKPYDTAYSYYYILEDRNVVVYSEGASEQVYSAAIMINNKKGIDEWKEWSIPYNNYFQTVQILKAEVVKTDGSRVPAETSGNEIVFAKMEPGDAIYYSYKISNYGAGRLGREFWDKFIFNSIVPARECRYNIMVAEDLPFFFDLKNDQAKPVEGKKELFHTYSWVMKDLPAMREESYMPARQDIAKVLHLSTVKSWDVIAEWYSDITRIQSMEDFELNEAFKSIFPQGATGLTDQEKARRIYEFIENNIAYSSVSFRQSAYVPQLAGKTLQTRLGDCKDMSTLFLAFARKAGLNANLMLVNTRNNGLETIALPSMEFNHCIVRYEDKDKECFLELTDNLLPFHAFTRSLANAQVLNIPFDYKTGEKLQWLRLNNNDRPAYIRKVTMKVQGNDCEMSATLRNNGELASSIRSDYLHRTLQERKDALQQDLSGQFKNQVILHSFDFVNLDNLADTVIQKLNFRVKNEIISMGDFNMLRPFFMDIVATANIFSGEKRQYPFAYYNYEAADQYHTVVEIELPEGKAFDQVPSDQELGFLAMKYSLRYQRTAPNKLLVERLFKTDCTLQLAAKDFEGMEDFFNKIITAEQKYISYK